jgi:hypothetical protein
MNYNLQRYNKLFQFTRNFYSFTAVKSKPQIKKLKFEF